jgi:hypothetical protein
MNPKTLQDIVIRQSRTTTAGVEAGDVVESRMTVAEKIEEYVFRIGCSNAHALGLVLQLLTVGKVRVDFREYYERLQLLTKADLLPRPQAIPLVEEFLESLRPESTKSQESEMTQKVIIQPPKPLKP